MARSFSKAQLRVAIETVRTAGLEIHAIEFPPDGGFKLVLNADAVASEINPWDEVLDIESSPPRRGR